MLILNGSARRDGNTALTVVRLRDALGGPSTLINLSDPPIPAFDYEDRGRADAFAAAGGAMLEHEIIVCATPVYWYAMSAQMKALFDRFTDLLGTAVGRGLTGRTMLLLANGTDPRLPAGFETPFRRTARYLGMAYGGGAYVRFEGDGEMSADGQQRITQFSRLAGPGRSA